MALETYNCTPHQHIHHAKFDFKPTTWVIWTNSQFATVLVCFSSFLYFFFVFFGSPTSRTGGLIVTDLRLIDVFCSKDVVFGVIIFNYHIFAYFSPKIVKIKHEIRNFKPKC